MPGLVLDEDKVFDEMSENGSLTKTKENSGLNKSPDDAGSVPASLDNVGAGNNADVVVEPSIKQLYDNVCEMQSSDQSLSRLSYGSDGEESRIDSELRHLVGGEIREVEIIQKDVKVFELEEKEKSLKSLTPENSKKGSQSQLNSEETSRSSSKNKNHQKKPLLDKQSDKNLDLGSYLLKQAWDLMSFGVNPRKALDLALRATKSFKICANDKPSLDVMCLHVTAAIYCNLGQFNEVIQELNCNSRD